MKHRCWDGYCSGKLGQLRLMTPSQASSHVRLQAISGPGRHSCSRPGAVHLWTIDSAIDITDLQPSSMNYFADSNL